MHNNSVPLVSVRLVSFDRSDSLFRLYFTGNLKGDFEINKRVGLAVASLFTGIGFVFAALAFVVDGLSLLCKKIEPCLPGKALQKEKPQLNLPQSPEEAACEELFSRAKALEKVASQDKDAWSQAAKTYNCAVRSLVRLGVSSPYLDPWVEDEPPIHLNNQQRDFDRLVKEGMEIQGNVGLLGIDDERVAFQSFQDFTTQSHNGVGLEEALRAIQWPQSEEARRGLVESIQTERWAEVRNGLFLDCYYKGANVMTSLDRQVQDQILASENRVLTERTVLEMLFRKLLEDCRAGDQNLKERFFLLNTQWKHLVNPQDQQLNSLLVELSAEEQRLFPPASFMWRVFTGFGLFG